MSESWLVPEAPSEEQDGAPNWLVEQDPVQEPDAEVTVQPFVPPSDKQERIKKTVEELKAQQRDKIKAAEAYRLSREEGLPMDIAYRQADKLTSRRKDVPKFDPAAPASQSFAYQPDRLGMLDQDDVDKMGAIEKAWTQLSIYRTQNTEGLESADIGSRMLFGTATKQDETRLNEIRAQQSMRPEISDSNVIYGAGVIDQAIKSTGQSFIRAWDEVAVGAGLGAVTGGTIGGTTGTVVLPGFGTATGAAGGAALGAVAGGVTGLKVGMASDAFQQVSGQVYLDAREMLDENGNKIDDDLAKGVAIFTGVMGGGLELVSLKLLKDSIPGLDNLLTKKGVTELVAKAQGNSAMRASLIALAKAAAGEGLQEVGEQVSQVLSSMAVGGEYDANGEKLSAQLSPEELAKTFGWGAVGGAGISVGLQAGTKAVTSTYNFARSRVEAKRQTLVQMGDVIRKTGLSQRSPEAFAEYAAELDKAGESQMTAPAEALSKLFQDAGLSADQISQSFPELAQHMNDAAESGSEVPISAQTFVKLAGLEGYDEFTKDIRTAPEEMTAREAEVETQGFEEMLASMSEQDREKAVVASLEEELTTALVESGQMDAANARKSAKIAIAGQLNLARRAGVSVEQLAERYKLKIQSGMTAGPDAMVQNQSRRDMSFRDVTQRIPELTEAAKRLQAGEISQAEYNDLVARYKPVEPYTEVPMPATPDEAVAALTVDKKERYGAPASSLQDGSPVGLRLDIPAYRDSGTWVVSVHEQQAGFAAGKSIGYESVAVVTDATFGMPEKAALAIAAGKPKGTIATIKGNWKSISPDAAKIAADAALIDPAWRQVGMDPERHSYFYDRETMQPVVAADEVIQIGPLVLAKNVKYAGSVEFLFQPDVTQTPAFQQWFGDSKVVDESGAPLVVYHGTDALDFSAFNIPSFFTENPSEAGAYTNAGTMARRDRTLRNPKYRLVEGDGGLQQGQQLPYVGIAEDIPAEGVGQIWATDNGVVRVNADRTVDVFSAWEADYDSTATYGNNGDMSLGIKPSDGRMAQRLVEEELAAVDRMFPQGEGEGGRVYPVYLSIQNPIELSATEANQLGARLQTMTPEEVQAYIVDLEAQGYDGIATYSDEATVFPEVRADLGGIPRQYIPFRKSQIKSVFNRGTFDPNEPNILFQDERPRRAIEEAGQVTGINLATSLGKAFQLASSQVFRTGRDLKLALQQASLDAQAKQGIDLTTLDDENIDRLADFAYEDAIEALQDNANAIGWYDRTVRAALETVAEIYPEILTDDAAKLQFIWALAVTSNGIKVDKNFDYAGQAYDALKKTGRFPTIKAGEASAAINSGLAMYHTMLEKFGGDHAALAEFMVGEFTVKEIESTYDVKISGEGKGTIVRGASILGPKIGNGFFANLYGRFDALTMDRWLMRSVGRWRGTLISINEPMIKQKTAEIKDLLANLTPAETKALQALYAGTSAKISKRMSVAEVQVLAAFTQKLSTKPAWRAQINAIGVAGESLRKAGNALAKYMDGQVEAPAGSKERTFLRKVFTAALERLQNAPEVRALSNQELTMSDLQALLWYPEKRLYDTAKQSEGESRGYEDDEAPDYANAARNFVNGRLGRSGSSGRAGGRPANDGRGVDTLRFNQDAPGNAMDAGRAAAGGDTGGQVAPRSLVERLAGYEGRPRLVDGETYASAMRAAGEQLGPLAAQVSFVAPDANVQRFLLDDGITGFALDGDNIIGVFSSPEAPRGAAQRVLAAAVEAGGRRLDGFNTFLPKIYSRGGFRAVARLPFNSEYAPSVETGALADWDAEAMEAMSPGWGSPDVTFMVYDPANASKDTDNVVDDYDLGIAAQNAAIEQKTRLEQSSEPVFYSALLRGVESSQQPKAPPAQWMGLIKNMLGVKQEEIEWLGVEEWLKSQDGSVTREDLADYIRANQVQVEDVMLGQPAIETDPAYQRLYEAYGQEIDRLNEFAVNIESQPVDLLKEMVFERIDGNAFMFDDDGGALSNDINSAFANASSLSEADWQSLALRAAFKQVEYLQQKRTRLTEILDERSQPKYAAYTLRGGSEYRELLLTLPAKLKRDDVRPSEAASAPFVPEWESLLEELKDVNNRLEQARMSEAADAPFAYSAILDERRAVEAKMDAVHQKMVDREVELNPRRVGRNYKSGHFDQKNILAHVRFNERAGPDGERVLFVEEIQSDWHQEGRRKGYDKPITAKDIVVEQVMPDELDETTYALFKDFGIHRRKENGIPLDAPLTRSYLRGTDPRFAYLSYTPNQPMDEIVAYHRKQAENKGGVPDAPLKTTWPEFAFKRMLRYAIDNGFDSIAWTPGSVQIDRYETEMRRNVDEIIYERMDMGDGSPISYAVDAIKDGRSVYSNEGLSENEVEDLFGKEIATKIVNNEGNKPQDMPLRPDAVSLTGDNLAIGGEGMKGFYDKMLPKMAAKLTKKMGGKVGTTTIMTGDESVGSGQFAVFRGEEMVAGPYASSREARDWRQNEGRTAGDGYSVRELPAKGQGTQVWSLPITDEMRATVSQGLPMFQGGQEPRGFIEFTKARDIFTITLTGNANLSTFLHEMGHYFLEVMTDLVETGQGNIRMQEDLKILREWAGVGPDGKFQREHHEKFARAFEAYLMGGVAPSVGLRGLFNRFKGWLTFIYKNIASLNVDLTDEVRGVMDRMLASDEEIARAKRDAGHSPAPMGQEEMGLTDSEYEQYLKLWEASEEAARAEVDARQMKDFQLGQSDAFKQEVQRNIEAMTKELEKTRGFQVWMDLQERDLKLDRESLTPEQRKLAFGLFSTPGIDADAYAEAKGYSNALDMLNDIAQTKQKRSNIPAEAKAMAEKAHGMMGQPDLEKAAEIAVHNAQQQELLLMEYMALTSRDGRKARKGFMQWVNQTARDRVGSLTRRQLDPSRWRRAELKAANEAGAATARGDTATAALAKRRQLMAGAMYRASLEADQRFEKLRNYLVPFAGNKRRQQLGWAGDMYLDPIDEILEGISFKRISAKQVARQNTLADLLVLAEQNGEMLDVPEKLRNQVFKKDWQSMTLDELEAVRDTVANIWKLAKKKNELRANKERRTLEQFNRELALAAENAIPAPELKDKFNKTVREQLKSWKDWGVAALMKPELIFSILDGVDAGGLSHRFVFQPFVDAQNNAYKWYKRYSETIYKRLASMPKDQASRWKAKITFLGDDTATGETVIAAALNLGNDVNRKRLFDGEARRGFTPEQILSEINNWMTKEDWDLVQHIWDEVNMLWPELERVARVEAGIPLEKQPATPVETPYGTYQGGYYPIKYDPARSKTGQKADEKTKELFGNPMTFNPVVTAGAKNARISEVKDSPLLLNLSVLTRHLSETIHYVTHYEAVNQANKVLRSRDFQNIVTRHLGKEYNDVLRQWLLDISRNQDAPDVGIGGSIGSNFFRNLRVGGSYAGLGLNLFTAFKQPLGLMTNFDALPAKYVLRGFADMYLRPLTFRRSAWRFATENSKELEELVKGYDRDVKLANRLFRENINKRWYRKFQEAAFLPMGYMQGMVNVAAWMGGYHKAMDDGLTHDEAVNYADAVVRQTQSSGALKDLSAVQRGDEATRVITMFYSWLNLLFARTNRQLRQNKAAGRLRSSPKLIAHLFWVYVATTMIEEAGRRMWEGLTGEEEDDEDVGYLLSVLLKSGDLMIATVPVLRNFVQLGGDYGLSLTPIERPIKDIDATINALQDLVSEGEIPTAAELKKANRAFSVITKTPTAGVWTTIEEGLKIKEQLD